MSKLNYGRILRINHKTHEYTLLDHEGKMHYYTLSILFNNWRELKVGKIVSFIVTSNNARFRIMKDVRDL